MKKIKYNKKMTLSEYIIFFSHGTKREKKAFNNILLLLLLRVLLY
jgi:hypothetical protein